MTEDGIVATIAATAVAVGAAAMKMIDEMRRSADEGKPRRRATTPPGGVSTDIVEIKLEQREIRRQLNEQLAVLSRLNETLTALASEVARLREELHAWHADMRDVRRRS